MNMKLSEVKKELLPPYGTQALCRNLVDTKFESLSEDNVAMLKSRLLDMTGCIFGGDIVPEDRFFYDLLKRQGGAEEAPLFADKGRLPLTSAVMHNCIHARANDYGNMNVEIFGEGIASHFGETMIPMSLTLADVFGVSGKDFITNQVVAEDTVARILYTLPDRWPTDMQLVSTAATAIAARYYKLDAAQAKVAFSYAATNATDPANSYYDYCQEFKLHNGESARMGILAAEIAKSGCWNGLEDPYFGHWGLISNKVPEGCLPDLYEKAFDGLGAQYYTEMRFKKGPGGIPTTAADACGKLLRQKMIEKYGKADPEQIKAVHVFCSDNIRHNYYQNPFSLRSHVNALFSHQFAVCCCLVYGARRIDLVQTPAILANEMLVRLAENSTMGRYPSPDGKKYIKATMELADGTVLEAEVDYDASMAERPTQEFIEAKFWEQFDAFGKLPKHVGEEIIRLAGRIEELDDMREYTSLLCLN
ncbi:MAG: MmgE/PrpD family protein [Ruminococcaceae bacterium]|nr:MmgE/PrpD family protein [Oscillospiraceae bacterium]